MFWNQFVKIDLRIPLSKHLKNEKITIDYDNLGNIYDIILKKYRDQFSREYSYNLIVCIKKNQADIQFQNVEFNYSYQLVSLMILKLYLDTMLFCENVLGQYFVYYTHEKKDFYDSYLDTETSYSVFVKFPSIFSKSLPEISNGRRTEAIESKLTQLRVMSYFHKAFTSMIIKYVQYAGQIEDYSLASSISLVLYYIERSIFVTRDIKTNFEAFIRDNIEFFIEQVEEQI